MKKKKNQNGKDFVHVFILFSLKSVEDTWVYSAVIYTMMKADGGAIKDTERE